MYGNQMAAVIVLILRILLVVLLYGFLGWAIYSIWKDLRIKSQLYVPQSMPQIKLMVDDLDVHPFQQKVINIGRDPICDLVIKNDTISGHHARISYQNNQWWLEDLNSTNGTYLNLDILKMPTVLMNNDVIQCGSKTISVTLPQ